MRPITSNRPARNRGGPGGEQPHINVRKRLERRFNLGPHFGPVEATATPSAAPASDVALPVSCHPAESKAWGGL